MTHNKTSQSIETGRKKKQKMRLVGKDSKEAIFEYSLHVK